MVEYMKFTTRVIFIKDASTYSDSLRLTFYDHDYVLQSSANKHQENIGRQVIESKNSNDG